MAKQDREALEALVATGDTSVPGIEMSDLNDGDILARTRDEVRGNQFRFVYTPDNGEEPITSDWVQYENKSKYAFQWVEGVKASLVARSQEKVQAAKDAAYAVRAKQIRDEQFETEDLIDEESKDHSPVLRTGGDKVIARTPKRSSQANSDPHEYIAGELELSRERLRVAEAGQQELLREVIAARKAVEKWTLLANALAGTGTVATVPDSSESAIVLSSRRTS